MATVHAGMAMSLDGFVADRNGRTARLSDPAALRGSEYMTALIQATGAVVMGRRTFAMAEDPAIAQAKAAAGPRVVQVLGASVVQQVLRAGLADELHVDVAPVLLGAGLRLFDDPDLEEVALKKVGVQEVGPITSLRFLVVK
jgi:dihydrofolate reductase